VWSRILRGLEGDPGRAGPAASLLGRVAAASLLILMTATWQLWSVTTFPRVPLVGALLRLPGWVEWTALAAFAAAQLVALIWGFDRRAGRRGVAISVLALGVLVLADQHRLQPWVYQLLVLEIVLAGLPAAEAIAVTRLLVASIYFYSALSKLDRSFFESGGGQIVDGLLESLRLTGSVTDGNRAVLAASWRWANCWWPSACVGDGLAGTPGLRRSPCMRCSCWLWDLWVQATSRASCCGISISLHRT